MRTRFSNTDDDIVNFWKTIYSLKSGNIPNLLNMNGAWIIRGLSPAIRKYYEHILKEDGRPKTTTERISSAARNLWNTGDTRSRAIALASVTATRIYNKCETDISDAVHKLSLWCFNITDYYMRKTSYNTTIPYLRVAYHLLFDLIICFYPIISTNVFSSITVSTQIFVGNMQSEDVLDEAKKVYKEWQQNSIDYSDKDTANKYLFCIAYSIIKTRESISTLQHEDEEQLKLTLDVIKSQFKLTQDQRTDLNMNYEDWVMKNLKRVSPLEPIYDINAEIKWFDKEIRKVLVNKYNRNEEQVNEYMDGTVGISLVGIVSRAYHNRTLYKTELRGIDEWRDQDHLTDALRLQALKRAYMILTGIRTTNTFGHKIRRVYEGLTAQPPSRGSPPS